MKQIFLSLLLVFSLVGIAQATDYTADPSCVGAWLMDVDEDPLTDSSGQGNTAALKAANEPNYATASPPAAYSTGYYVWDNNDDYARVGDSADWDATTALSIVNWVYSNSINAAQRMVERRSVEYIFEWYIRPTAWGGAPGIRIDIASDNAITYTATGGTAMNSTTWYHCAMVLDTTIANPRIVIYLNGVPDGTGNFFFNTGILTGSSVVDLGDDFSNAPSSDYPLNGNLDETAIFKNYALSSTEINDIMDNGLKPAVTSTPRNQVFIFD